MTFQLCRARDISTLLQHEDALGLPVPVVNLILLASRGESSDAVALHELNKRFVVCGLIMLAGNLIGMIFIRPEREVKRLTERPVNTTARGTLQQLSQKWSGRWASKILGIFSIVWSDIAADRLVKLYLES